MKTLGELKLIRKFLARLGLSAEEQQVYATLVEQGTATVLTLARSSGINRTTTYRVLEQLKSLLLVEEIVDEHRTLYRISGVHILEQLLKEREAETKLLRDLFPTIAPLVTTSAENSQPGTKVLFYRGVAGIKQMIWNVLKAEKEAVGYSYRTIETIVGKQYTDEWMDEFRKRNLTFRDIISDSYVESKAKLKIPIVFDEPHFYTRYLPAKTLDINHQTDIYNDVVAFYNWYEGEVFGVEIYNEKIAAMHKQLFEIVWKLGKSKLP